MHRVQLIVYTHTKLQVGFESQPCQNLALQFPQKVSVLRSLLSAKDRQIVLIDTSSWDDFTATEATVCYNEPPSHINF